MRQSRTCIPTRSEGLPASAAESRASVRVTSVSFRAAEAGLLSAALLICLAWLLAGSPALAQHSTFAQFGQSDGLLNQDVTAIVQDKRGVLWVGTENGVFLADGSHFEKVQSFEDARDGSVLAMHVDSTGRVWVLGSRRLVFYTEDHRLHPVSAIDLSLLLDSRVAVSSLPSRPNTVFLLLNGHLQQVQTNNGGVSWDLSPVFTDTELARQPVLEKLAGLAADPERGALWTGCDRGLCELQIPEAEAVRDTPSVTIWDSGRGVPPNSWTWLMPTRDGRVWARGAREVLRLDPRTWGVERFGNPSGGTGPEAHDGRLAEDADGTIVANLCDGVARLRDGHWSKLTAANGLPPSQIGTMFFDRRGGFWLAPVGGGIWRWLGYENWQGWTRFEGLSGNVTWGMVRDKKGRLWAAAAENLVRVDEEQGRAVPQKSGQAMGNIDALAGDARGHLWAGTAGGAVLDFNPATERARKLDDSLGSVYRILEERGGGRVWICSAKGVEFATAEDGWQLLHPVHEMDSPGSNVWDATEDKSGSLWFTARGGLYRLADGHWTRIRAPAEAEGVDYPSLQAAPDGTLWMQGAMPNPLLHLRVDGSTAQIIGAVPGSLIGSDDISFIRFDRRGWLWVGTDIGVYVNDGQRWVHCTQEDGLLSDDMDTAAVLADTDGSMWFGTVGGLSHLLDPAELFRVPPPQISVRDVRLNGTELQAGAHPRFDMRDPELAIALFSTDYTRPRAVEFRYRLHGLEDGWQTSAGGNLHFSGLAPGSYVLSVQAMDTRVHALSPPIDYAFTILPPWYLRDRAKVLGVLVLLTIAIGWWRLSIRSLKASEATLKAKVDHQTAQLLAEKEQLERAQRELVESSKRDALTGLLNRSAIFEVLGRMRRLSLESGMPLSVIMADLDHFKSINDRWGHTVGDAVLRECAERFRETLRPGDAVGRYGGEEVLIVIPGLNAAHAVGRLEEIREAIASRPIVHGAHKLHVTCSFGVAWLDGRHRDVESIVNDADAALYVAKQSGRNRVEFAPELEDHFGGVPVREFPAVGVEIE